MEPSKLRLFKRFHPSTDDPMTVVITMLQGELHESMQQRIPASRKPEQSTSSSLWIAPAAGRFILQFITWQSPGVLHAEPRICTPDGC
jgi:hypothetical protein